MADARPNPELPKVFQQSILKGRVRAGRAPQGVWRARAQSSGGWCWGNKAESHYHSSDTRSPGGPVLMITEWLTSSIWWQGFGGFCHFKNIYLFLIDWRLVYNIGLISNIHQHELTRWVHMPPPSWLSHHLPPIPTPLGYSRAPVWVPWVIRQIPIGHLFTYVSTFASTLLIHLTRSLFSPTLVHKPVLYVCISITALWTGSSAPSFQIPYRYVNI